ncbi:MAG: cytidine deaminase [Deltaproteobacteria bacterium]|jgi:cytidine deaminase|nr:cytidine deaminase [Deltaproteobacteria bacterium]
MTDRQKQFEAALKEFPEPVRKILQTIPLQAGRLFAPQCAELVKHLGIDPEALMVRLLPLAKVYAVVPVSRFQVGAVAMAGAPGPQGHAGPFDLFLGANMEFRHQPLNQTIHAEQSATVHAWHQGAQNLQAIATSEAPCGHCRQFLYEFEKNAQMMVITADRQSRAYRKKPLSDLLPEAFGPLELGNRSGLMLPAPQGRKLQFNAAAKDRIIDEALAAAEKSYAPYTQNFAGCALETQSGEIYSGRYVESAAFNPSLTPLHSAILCLNMATMGEQRAIQRVVLVEKPTLVGLRKVTELLLESWAPGVALEYYHVK